MSRQGMLRACASAALAALGGCVHQNVIALAPGSTPDSLFFLIATRDVRAPSSPFPGIVLVRCMDHQPMWAMVVQRGPSATGSLPPTSVDLLPSLRMRPEPLLPDCYEAVAPGAKSLRFFVDIDGNIIVPR